jgi:hypothetical protein
MVAVDGHKPRRDGCFEIPGGGHIANVAGGRFVADRNVRGIR